MKGTPHSIGFLYVGGAHQLLHTAPVAAELARAGCLVTAFIASEEEHALFDRVWRAYGSPPVTIRPLPVPAWAWGVDRLVRRWSTMKVPRLIAARPALTRLDAVVTPEYTSTLLKRLPGRAPVLIHIPHGSGDRARSVDPRLALYDFVIVAGEKTRNRMVHEGAVRPDRIAAGGSPKLGAMARLAGRAPPLFAGARPTILYNPHFDSRTGSWSRLGRAVIDRLAGSAAFNLIVAPHIRLFEHASASRRATVERLAVPGKLLVDLGSAASSDMTYTGAADIYLGDVSSQVNEFAAQPRPCVFLNAHRVEWRDDPNYLFWHMGEVIEDVADLLPALARAPARFAEEYRAVQVAMARRTFGEDIAGAPARVADLVTRFVDTVVMSQKRRIALSSAGAIFGHSPDEHRGTP
jgi:hypothetical protein